PDGLDSAWAPPRSSSSWSAAPRWSAACWVRVDVGECAYPADRGRRNSGCQDIAPATPPEAPDVRPQLRVTHRDRPVACRSGQLPPWLLGLAKARAIIWALSRRCRVDSPMMEYAFFQGRIVPFAEAKISIGIHTVQYGTGAFAGI